MIELQGIEARVGAFALRDVSFRVPRGEYGVVIGPAGSGKTTLIETIAGVTPHTAGRLTLGGRDAASLPMEERSVGLVYQHAFLFPHLDVAHNIGYGAADPRVVKQLFESFDLDSLAHRSVASLSGGERQIVAIARALARRPAILLLDEPFGALDPHRRTLVRRQVRDLHRVWGTTVLQVTHDFTEAGLLGDLMILLDAGRVLQSGPPADVFARPASAYVAEFLGAENVLSGTASAAAERENEHEVMAFTCGGLTLWSAAQVDEGPCHAVIRAEEVVLSRADTASSMRNHFLGTVSEIAGVGPHARITVLVSQVPLVAALTWRSVRELRLQVGEQIVLSFKAFAVHLC
jgi:molybdopterin-binding protein